MSVTTLKLAPMKDLEFHFGLKLRAYPSNQQKAIIDYNGHTNRFLYNQKVAHGKLQYRLKRYYQLTNPTIYQQMTLKYWQNKFVYPQTICLSLLQSELANNSIYVIYLTDAQQSKAISWMIDNRSLQDSLMPKQCQKTYRSAWQLHKQVSQVAVPTYHKKSYHISYQTACLYSSKQSTQLWYGSVRFLDQSHMIVPKIGRIRVAGSIQRILDLANNQLIRIGTVTVSHNPDNLFTISLQLGSNKPFVNLQKKANHVKTALGIDLNTSNFLTDSSNNSVDNPRYYRKALNKLKTLQQQLSRKQRRAKAKKRKLRESKNYQRQRQKLAHLHSHVANQRTNFLQTTSAKLIKNHDLLVVEHLQSKNMLRNHKLAMSISDVGWTKFISLLKYKQGLYHVALIEVDPKWTTQICSNCGFRMGTHGTNKLTLKDREWDCPNCGVHHIRDHNAAINILYRGLQSIA